MKPARSVHETACLPSAALTACAVAATSGAVQMVESIVLDQRRILPCAAWLQGEYGMQDLYLGVPCKLGKGGLLQVLEVELTGAEREALEKSAQAVREPMAAVKL